MGIHSRDLTAELLVSQADSRPMYLQIVEQVRQRVASGDWAPGWEIPSIRQLAVALRVSVITVKRAYLELEREGAILTQHGKGSVVAGGGRREPGLLEAELGRQLAELLRLGSRLGLSVDELVERLRAAAGDNLNPLTEEQP